MAGEVVLVSGGAGFIGSHVVDQLVEEGHRVRVLDALDPSVHRDRPGYLNPEAEYVEADVRSPEAWERCLAGVSAVSHQAAKVGLGLDPGDVLDYVSVNDLGTAAMLLAMHRARFRGPLVLASSMAVYGEGRFRCPEHGLVRPGPRTAEALRTGRFDPPCPRCGEALSWSTVDEEAPADPRTTYAATKLHQEHLCAAFARETGVPFAALRYHNVYGPRLPAETPYAGVAAIFRSRLASGLPPRVFEDGGQVRDFVHVRDVARANVLVLLADPPVTGPINVASGQAHTILEMAEALARASGGPAPEMTGEFRLGDVRHIVASIDRARQVLGYEPEVAFAEGMAELATAPMRGLEDLRPSTRTR
jgi:dTDP-L-rhamnose 4-epimerase